MPLHECVVFHLTLLPVPSTLNIGCCCRRFDAAAFRSELKEVLRAAGVEGTPLLLFLEERHLADDPGRRGYLCFVT